MDNLAEKPVLLLDGEEVMGAKQNRILNLSVLCAAKSQTTLPVSCVEQGRWSYRSRKFRSAGRTLFGAARAAKMRSVSASILRESSRRSDQSEVWDQVDLCLSRSEAHSDTGASEAAYFAKAKTTEAYATAMPAVANQVGAVYAVNGKAIALELLHCPCAYAKVHRKLLESLVVDVGTNNEAPGHDTPVDASLASEFMRDLSSQECGRYDAIGLGHDLRIETRTLVGAALEFNGELLHLSAFRIPERAP